MVIKQTIRRILLKKMQVLIDREIGDKKRLEDMQMKVARSLPLLTENKAYLDALILKNFSEEEVESIVKEIGENKLEKTEIKESELRHCIACGKIGIKLDDAGMCLDCYDDYRIKIAKFLTAPMSGA